MLVETAIQLLSQVCYKPEWEFTITDNSKRFENSVKVRISYPAFETDREDAKNGFPRKNQPYADFCIMVGSLDDVSLYRKLAECIMQIEEHEMREFLRISPTHWAPFHPHQEDGMNRWGNPHSDLTFGLA